VGKSGAAAAAGVGTGGGRCRNGRKAVAAAKVGVPLTDAGRDPRNFYGPTGQTPKPPPQNRGHNANGGPPDSDPGDRGDDGGNNGGQLSFREEGDSPDR
jgi:hypothetical protein